MLSMDKFKKKFGRITEYFCAKISLPDSYKFRRVFSIVVLDDVNDGGTPYMGISPGRTRPARIDRSESSQSTRFNQQRCTGLAREERL